MNLFDLHCDTASCMVKDTGNLLNGNYQVTLEKAEAFENWAQVFAIFIHDNIKNAQEAYRTQIKRFQQELSLYHNRIVACRDTSDLETAFTQKKRAAILSVENGSALGGSLEMLKEFQNDGIKLLTLTWFGENELGFGSMAGGRLKPFGRDVLKALPQHKIVPDISHLSDEGVAEVFSLYDGTLVATHSNVRTVTGHCRNLTNFQIEEIVRRKGLIGLNLYRGFLSSNATTTSCDDVYRHIDAFLKLGAEDTLAFGADLDGGGGTNDLPNISALPRIYEYLLQKNIPQPLVDKIFFENAVSFWRRSI